MMKMKRSKNDVIKTTVGSYLKRRHYSDSDDFRSSDIQLCQTHEQMAILASVEKEAANPNTFIYSCMSFDISQFDNQFSSFQSWLAELSPSMNHELTPLTSPIFCHLYLDMFLCCPRPVTLRFLKRYQGLLMGNPGDRELFEGLLNAQLNDAAEVNSAVEKFRSSKFHIKLTQKSLILLQKYLVKQGHMALLQVLNMYFTIEVGVCAKPKDDDSSVSSVTVKHIKIEPISDEEEEEDSELIRLREIIQLVRESPASCPRLQLFTIGSNVCNVNTACRLNNEVTAVGWENEVRLFGPGTGTCTSSFKPTLTTHCPWDMDAPEINKEKIPVTFSRLQGHSGLVQDINSLGNLTLSVSRDKTMRAWNNGSCVAIYRGHNYPIWRMDVGPLGSIATASRDRTARLWTLDRLHPLRIFAGHSQDVECVKFHPNGQYLATGSTDRTVRLWSVTQAKMVRVFAGSGGAVQAVGFSPDGKMIAAGGEDKRIRVWDLAAGSILHELRGHSGAIQDVCWSEDSEQLASCSLDGSVRLWDVKRSSTSKQQLAVYDTRKLSLLRVYFPRTITCVGTARHKQHAPR